MSVDCIFCKIVAGEIPSDQLYQDELVTAFRDISAQAPVHILIVPNQHFNDVGEMGDAQADTSWANYAGRFTTCYARRSGFRRMASRHQRWQARRPRGLPHPFSPAWWASPRSAAGALI